MPVTDGGCVVQHGALPRALQGLVGPLRQDELLGAIRAPRSQEGERGATPGPPPLPAAGRAAEVLGEVHLATAVRPRARMRPQQHLLETGVRLRVLLFGRHREAGDVRRGRRGPQLLDVVGMLPVVAGESVLVWRQGVRVPGHDAHPHAVVVIRHGGQGSLRRSTRRAELGGAAVQVVVVVAVALQADPRVSLLRLVRGLLGQGGAALPARREGIVCGRAARGRDLRGGSRTELGGDAGRRRRRARS
eukprot:2423908-Pyramimonas_sp.AAC.1